MLFENPPKNIEQLQRLNIKDLIEQYSSAEKILNKDDFTYSLYKDFIVDEYDYKYSIQYRDRMKHDDSNTIHFVALNYKKNKKSLDLYT